MRLASIFLFLSCTASAQFFGNQQSPQNQQQHPLNQQQQHPMNQQYNQWNSPQNGVNSNPYQPGMLLNQPYAQRTGQVNPGGIFRPNPAQVPNSQTNQHPIFDLMRNQHAAQQRQAPQPNPNLYQNHAPQSNPMQMNSNPSHPNPQMQQQHSADPRPRAYNRLANRLDQWTGSSGINSPGIFTAPARRASALNPGASFYLQLTSYTNNGLGMKGGTSCYCPREECTIIENILHPCYFSFTAVVSPSGGEPVQYIAKTFVAINSTGILSPNEGDWSSPVTLQMVSKPTQIDIFVHNLGPVIQGRQVLYLDEFWQVDMFTIDLSDYTPAIANQQPTPVTTRLTGQLVNSILEVNYYVQCQAGLLGENCDLQCRPTRQQDPPRSVCTSRITNSSSVCGMDTNRQQVQNCQLCGYGVVRDECADLSNFNGNELGVSSAFRVWTIVLGVLLGIAIIFIIILIFMYVIAERRLKEEHRREAQNRNRRQNGGRNGNGAYENGAGRHAPTNALLGSEWDKPVAHQPHGFVHHGVESESNQSDSAPPRSGIPSAFQQPRREAQV